MTPQDPPASEAGQGQQRNVHALIDKVFSRKHLARAWEQVAKNRGSAGIDEVTMAQCEDRQEYDVELLHRKRRAGTSQPKPVKRVEIPKSEGGVRKLGIPRVVDRVGLPALVQRMEPIFEPTFLDSTVGYRAGRAPHDAMQKVWQELKAVDVSFDGAVTQGQRDAGFHRLIIHAQPCGNALQGRHTVRGGTRGGTGTTFLPSG